MIPGNPQKAARVSQSIIIVNAVLFVIGIFLIFKFHGLYATELQNAENLRELTRQARQDYLDLKQKFVNDVTERTKHKVQKNMEDPNYSTNLLVYPVVKKAGSINQKRILVTGGAGFVGSHLVDKLMMQGHMVYVVDNYFTGRKKNIEHWIGHSNFEIIRHDVVNPILLEVDQIYHLACPASPPHYQYNPIKTIKTSSHGTLNMLGLARRVKARLLLASTSEVYGDPEQHPQKESYWGHVNPIGPRACYDEGKRMAETLCYSYQQQENVEVRVARIFNTFGPRMHPNDGRVVSNFIVQSLQEKPITIYGNGEQTRSFQYVDDLVDGLEALMNGEYTQPVNLGNPDEYTIKDFATMIRDMISNDNEITFLPGAIDDPKKRLPDISTAKREINWQPKRTVQEGLRKTIEYFRKEIELDLPTKEKTTKTKKTKNRK